MSIGIGGSVSVARGYTDGSGAVSLEWFSVGELGWLVNVRRQNRATSERDWGVYVPRPGGFSDADPMTGGGTAAAGRVWIDEGAGLAAEGIAIGTLGWIVAVVRAAGTPAEILDGPAFVPSPDGDTGDGPFA